MAQKVGEIYYDVTLDTSKLIDGQREVSREISTTTGHLDKFGAKLNQITAAIGAYAAALYLIEKSDAFTKMNAQLTLATESARELAIAQADVKRIAQESQSEISAVAALYAKVTTSTREMGTSQQDVADISRAVALSLKISGASAQESSSAILQLGQAFASGTLRGDEFNSVNEAAPRLMRALADGIGVPIGQLRSMAEAGKLTSEVLSTALPRALKDLEQEAKQIQTISGAFQELKNEVMLFVGEQSTASGAVKVITGAIGALSDNLGLLAGIMSTVVAVKFAVWLESIVTQAYATAAANMAMRTSTLVAAESQVVATSATVALTAARVSELRQSILAAEGNVALAITTNGLIPAQARAAAAAQAHAVAMAELTLAQKAASVSGMAAVGMLGLLGGPLGAIVTVLGLGATAWAMWGNSAKDESAKAAAAVEASGREIIASIEKQNAKLRERLELAKKGNVDAAKSDTKETEKLASILAEINALKAKGAAMTGSDKIQVADLEGRYRDLSVAIAENASLKKEIEQTGQASKSSEWLAKYATDAERLNAEIAKAKKELGEAFTPEIEQRIRAKFTPDKKTKQEKQPFDATKYLAGLGAKAADEWAKVAIVEAEALRQNDALLNKKDITQKQHEEAKTLIIADANKQREELMAKDTEAYLREMSDRYQRELMLKEKAEKGRDAAKLAISEAKDDPVERIRNEEQRKLDAMEEFRMRDVANSQLYEDAKLAIKKDAAKQEQAIQDQNNMASLTMAGNLAASMYDLLVKSGKEKSALGKALFLASKAMAVAEIIMNTEVAAAKAGAQLGIFGLPMATMIRATGYASAGMVAGMAVAEVSGGRQYGGPVSSGSLYRVNEQGRPEMFTAANGAQYMMPTTGGRVTSADNVGGGVQWSIVVNNTAPGATATASVDQNSRTISIAVSEVANQIRTNTGPVWSALKSSTTTGSRLS